MLFIVRGFLHGHVRFDVRVRVVIFQLEIFILEREDVFDFRIDAHGGQGPRIA